MGFVLGGLLGVILMYGSVFGIGLFSQIDMINCVIVGNYMAIYLFLVDVVF